MKRQGNAEFEELGEKRRKFNVAYPFEFRYN